MISDVTLVLFFLFASGFMIAAHFHMVRLSSLLKELLDEVRSGVMIRGSDSDRFDSYGDGGQEDSPPLLPISTLTSKPRNRGPSEF